MGKVFILAMLLAGGASAQVQERVVARCFVGVGEKERIIEISQRDRQAYWTEGDRRVEAQMIRSLDTDGILGITSNRRDGSISLLSMQRPIKPPVLRRRSAILTVHLIAGGEVTSESFAAHCDVEVSQ